MSVTVHPTVRCTMCGAEADCLPGRELPPLWFEVFEEQSPRSFPSGYLRRLWACSASCVRDWADQEVTRRLRVANAAQHRTPFWFIVVMMLIIAVGLVMLGLIATAWYRSIFT